MGCSKWPIEAVMAETGGRQEILEGLAWDDYCDLPAMNPSTIVHGVKSIKHLKHAWEKQDKDSAAKIFGRAVHCVLFEREELAMRFAVYRSKGDTQACRRGKEYDKFAADAKSAGRQVLLGHEFDAVLECGKQLATEPLVQQYINAGKTEVSLLAMEGDIQCRARLDWISESAGVLVDVKTARDITDRGFGRDFYRFKYDIKLGLYQRWLDRLTGKHWPVAVICVENVEPFDVTVIPIGDAVLDRGARKGLEVLSDLREAIDSGDFLGVGKGQEYWLDTPTWEMDDELEGAEVAT